MKARIILALSTAAYLAVGCNVPANAIGCVSGGLVGAVAGHMAHHGVLGAVGGCIAGHVANKRQKQREAAQYQDGNNPPPR